MSSNFESSKTLAGIGALLIALGGPLGIVGLILVFLGIKGLSDYYNDRAIYQKAINGLIFGVIGIAVATVVIFGWFFGGFFAMFAAWTTGVGVGLFALGIVILALVALFVFYLMTAINFRRAFNMLAHRSGEHLFETAGTILFIGAVLTIIGVGFFLVLIAWLIAAIAFLQMRTPQPITYVASPQSSTQPSQTTSYCPNCGAPVEPNAVYCRHCGKQLS